MSRNRFLLALTIVTAALSLGAGRALALSACTADDIVLQDAGCPDSSAACNITHSFDIADGCDLDFGSRNVTITAQGVLNIADGFVTIEAGSLTIAAGGFIDGRGNTIDQTTGGMIEITTAGAVTLQKSGAPTGHIDVSGRDCAGTIDISSGTTVTIGGGLSADALTTDGDGGTIRISATGNIQSLAASTLSAKGGSNGALGGSINLTADGGIALGEAVSVVGPDGGEFDATAGADIVAQAIDADAIGDGGLGGNVCLEGGTAVSVLGAIDARGSTSVDGFGGCGGIISLTADFGDLTLSDKLRAEGAGPDGIGGELDLSARGSLNVQSTGLVSARSNGSDGCGGTGSIDADLDINGAALFDFSGGAGGGIIDMHAKRHIMLAGGMTAAGRSLGGTGGEIGVVAGEQGQGDLAITSTVDVGAAKCTTDGDCGCGGCADLQGCNLTVTSAGKVLANGPDGGENDLVAREQITINGAVNAQATVAFGSDGVNTVTYPTRKPEMIGFGLVLPDPDVSLMDTCTEPGQQNCLIPCPLCGNGVVEYPETCDSLGTPASCDGCSASCQLENCNDGLMCTIDSCDPTLGCRSVPAPSPCIEPPTPTPTATPPPTITPTPRPTAPPCIGDCNRDGVVSAADLVTGINIALGTQSLASCPLADVSGDGVVTVDEIAEAVNVAHVGCSPP